MKASITFVDVHNFACDEVLLRESRALLSRYYRDPDVPLRYAIDVEATRVYMANDGNSVRSIFFARMPEKVSYGTGLAVYLGLTAGRRELCDASSRHLWSQFLEDCRAAVGPTKRLLAWYRTATPLGLLPARSLLHKSEPNDNGSISELGLGIVRELRATHSMPASAAGDHPFVVRSYAHARYNELECEFVAKWRERHPSDLIERLGVDERRGDRLLMFGYVP